MKINVFLNNINQIRKLLINVNSMDLKNFDLLDNVLRIVKDNPSITQTTLEEKLKEEKKSLDSFLISAVLQRLSQDNFLLSFHQSLPIAGQGVSWTTYSLSFDGLLFLEQGGYKSMNRDRKKNYYWTITKTIANTLNAVIIIIIAVATVILSWMSLHQEESNKNDIKTINSRLDSLIKK
jgi:hypothetical protein